MTGNPFTPTFGSEPLYLAGRERIVADFIEGLENAPGDPNRSTILVGPRGSGKTVLLVRIAEEAAQVGWISSRVTAAAGMLEDIIEQTQLNGREFLVPASRQHLTGIEFAGIGISREVAHEKQLGWRTRMTRLLDELQEHKVGLLIEVDEVSADEPELIRLSTAFQHFVSERRNVALLMAGLPGKVMDLLQHQKASFLRRSFQRVMEPLAQSEVEVAMRKTIEASGRTIDKEALVQAASSTEGFPFLVQLNGYHIWRQSPQKKRVSKQDVVDGLALAKADMDRMILTTTIGELSCRDLDFLVAMAQDASDSRIGLVAKRMGTSPSQASRHKRRLLALGLIEEKPLGALGFQLPLLREYLRDRYTG
jgi:hypothetical protein